MKIDFYYWFPFTYFDLKKVTDFNSKVTGRQANERSILQTYLEQYPANRTMPAYHPGLISNNMGLERAYKFRSEMWSADWNHSDLVRRLQYEKDMLERSDRRKSTELREHFAHRDREINQELDRKIAFYKDAYFDRSAYRSYQYRNMMERTAYMDHVRDARTEASSESKRSTQLGLFRQYNLTDSGFPKTVSFNAGDRTEELLWIALNRMPENPYALENVGKLLAASGSQASAYLTQFQNHNNATEQHLNAKSDGHALKNLTAAKKAG